MNDSPDPNLIQMYCDGECSTEQCAQVESHLAEHPELRQTVQRRMQFNAALRVHLGRMVTDTKAPDGLLDQVKLMFERAANAPATAGQIQPVPNASRRNRFAVIFEDPRRGNIFAIAASLALVAGAMLYGIFGRSIDDVTPANPSDVFAKAALFAEAEHGQCAGDKQTLSRKSQFTNIIEAEKVLSNWVASPVKMANLSDLGYEFVGAGQCNLPTTAKSGHIMYRKSGGQTGPSPMVSVFIFPNRGQCGGKLCQGMDCHQWYDCANGKCTHRVLRATDGRLVYLLVCCVDGDIDEVAKAITKTLHRGQH